MKKAFLITALLIGFIILFRTNVFASNDFYTDVESNYRFKDDGLAEVINSVTLENATSEKYVNIYKFNLTNIAADEIKIFYKSKEIPFEKTENNNETEIVITFPDAIVGKGAKRNFTIEYTNKLISQRSGDVWEIAIPKYLKSIDLRKYSLSFEVPESFGNEAYISPQPDNLIKENGKIKYIFNKNTAKENGIVAAFGEFQSYSVSLTYHLQNLKNVSDDFKIALPPDTSLQRVYYENISEKPENITIDEDGNWLAIYTLKPNERKDISAYLTVQVFANPRKLLSPQPKFLLSNLKNTKYWQSDNPLIINLAKNLKTPENIYNFVIHNLTYNQNRIGTNSKRYGALDALRNPDDAICMEFTDLFIAIARAAGIPAREVNGFAYSENSKTRPLSLISDVLHSWPEYWNDNIKTWVQIDPTWGSTSQVDYFSKLDLRHITFVIHGKDPELPLSPGFYKVGDNPQKDIFITFGQIPANKYPDIQIVPKINNSISGKKLDLTIKNNGNVAFYKGELNVNFDDKLILNNFIETIPPYTIKKYSENIPVGFMARNVPRSINIKFNENNINLFPNKIWDQLLQITLILMFLLFMIIIIFVKLNKLNLYKVKFVFINLYGKYIKKL